jgi:hypothetical protein
MKVGQRIDYAVFRYTRLSEAKKRQLVRALTTPHKQLIASRNAGKNTPYEETKEGILAGLREGLMDIRNGNTFPISTLDDE